MGRAITTTSVHLFWSNPFSKEAVHIVNIMNEITRLLINFKWPKGFLHLHVKSEYCMLKLKCFIFKIKLHILMNVPFYWLHQHSAECLKVKRFSNIIAAFS